VTGDSDFLEPIRTVKSLGKRVELAAWRDSIAQDLEMEASTDIFYLDENRAGLERSHMGDSGIEGGAEGANIDRDDKREPSPKVISDRGFDDPMDGTGL